VSRFSTQDGFTYHPTELSRIATQRSQHAATVGGGSHGRVGSGASKLTPAFGAGKPYPPQLPAKEEYVVEFDGPDDPLHAQNWQLWKKILTATMSGYTTVTVAFTSSIFSSATQVVALSYGVSTEVGLLGTSFYILGFASGPSLWAPLSELQGRRLPLVLSMLGFSIFSIGCATGKDIQTILISRFFSGFFGACPVTVVAAVFSDMFNNTWRGIAVTLFATASSPHPTNRYLRNESSGAAVPSQSQ
jgi:DHA1 family multidrug resistance protein-like MFS transporter